jgi:hypothetical protein
VLIALMDFFHEVDGSQSRVFSLVYGSGHHPRFRQNQAKRERDDARQKFV